MSEQYKTVWEQVELISRQQKELMEFDYSTSSNKCQQIRNTLGYLMDSQMSFFEQMDRMIKEELK